MVKTARQNEHAEYSYINFRFNCVPVLLSLDKTTLIRMVTFSMALTVPREQLQQLLDRPLAVKVVTS